MQADKLARQKARDLDRWALRVLWSMLGLLGLLPVLQALGLLGLERIQVIQLVGYDLIGTLVVSFAYWRGISGTPMRYLATGAHFIAVLPAPRVLADHRPSLPDASGCGGQVRATGAPGPAARRRAGEHHRAPGRAAAAGRAGHHRALCLRLAARPGQRPDPPVWHRW